MFPLKNGCIDYQRINYSCSQQKGGLHLLPRPYPGTAFVTSYRFKALGRLSTITHPSSIIETKNYNSYGYLGSISVGGLAKWTITSMNAFQKVTGGQYGSSLTTTYGYDSYGFLNSIVTGTIQNCSYNFNTVIGNLNWRQNNKYSNLKEAFNYDNLDRLDNVYQGVRHQ